MRALAWRNWVRYRTDNNGLAQQQWVSIHTH